MGMGTHLKEYERYLIESWLKQGMKPAEVARKLGRHRNTIYYEIKKGAVTLRNPDWTERAQYCADAAQRITGERGRHKGRGLKIGHDYALAAQLEHLIGDLRYSPYAAVQSIRQDSRFPVSICESTLYHYIDSGLFLNISNKNLPVKGKRKQQHKKVGVLRPSCKKPPEKSIDTRPASVGRRDSYGHWEMDTVYSGKGKSKACLLVLTERMTLDEYLIKMPGRTCPSTVEALDRLEEALGFEAFRRRFKTITVDNGSEFGDGSLVERSCTAPGGKRTTLYFCHPFCSGERGSNENQNKLVRRFIGKGEDIGRYSPGDIRQLQDWMNSYPRRKFNGMSTEQYKASLGIV